MNTPSIMTQPITHVMLSAALTPQKTFVNGYTNLFCRTIPLVCTVRNFWDMFSMMVLPSMFAIKIALPLLPCKYLRVSYTHCSVFKCLSKSQPISLNMRWHSCCDEFLHWFFYPVQVYEDHLSIFTVRTLQSSA